MLTEVWHDNALAGTTRGFYLNTRRTMRTPGSVPASMGTCLLNQMHLKLCAAG